MICRLERWNEAVGFQVGHHTLTELVSYELTEKYRMETAFFHLKYWLKLTYPIVV